jgi:hypothetical protein
MRVATLFACLFHCLQRLQEITMIIDLQALNQHQLVMLIGRAERRKLEMAKESIDRARRKIEILLESEGLTLEDVFGAPRSAHRSATQRKARPRARRRSGSSSRAG